MKSVNPQKPTEALATNVHKSSASATNKLSAADASVDVDNLAKINPSNTVVQGNILAPQSQETIGGSGGDFFQDAKYRQGIYITRIEVWSELQKLRGIQVAFSDGSTILRGRLQGTVNSHIQLEPNMAEVVTKLSIWSNGATNNTGRVTGIEVKTSKNRTFSHIASYGAAQLNVNVGSGIILGIVGRSGVDIDALGFLMLGRIVARKMNQIQYDIGNDESGIDRRVAYDITIPNPSNSDVNSGEIIETTFSEQRGAWFVRAGLTVGAAFKVIGKIPLLGKVEASAHWELSVEGGFESSWNESRQVTIKIPLIIPARTITRIEYFYFRGELAECPFTATMQYDLENGAKWFLTLTGVYEGVDTTRVVGHSELIARWDDERGVWVNVTPSIKKVFAVQFID